MSTAAMTLEALIAERERLLSNIKKRNLLHAVFNGVKFERGQLYACKNRINDLHRFLVTKIPDASDRVKLIKYIRRKLRLIEVRSLIELKLREQQENR